MTSLRSLRVPAWKSALIGFLTCALFTLALYLSLYIGAGAVADIHAAEVAEQIGKAAPDDRTWWVARAQRTAGDITITLLSMLALYWFAVAIFKSGSAKSSLVEKALIGSAVALFLLSGANQYFLWAETYCDVLPYPDEGFQISRIYECPSSGIFFRVIPLAAMLLLIASISVRILASRVRSKDTQSSDT